MTLWLGCSLAKCICDTFVAAFMPRWFSDLAALWLGCLYANWLVMVVGESSRIEHDVEKLNSDQQTFQWSHRRINLLLDDEVILKSPIFFRQKYLTNAQNWGVTLLHHWACMKTSIIKWVSWFKSTEDSKWLYYKY